MKFRKKPIIIEAVQYQGNIFIHPHICRAPGENEKAYLTNVNVAGDEIYLDEGDWIITGINGEHYPCKPDIFEKSYEPVE